MRAQKSRTCSVHRCQLSLNRKPKKDLCGEAEDRQDPDPVGCTGRALGSGTQHVVSESAYASFPRHHIPSREMEFVRGIYNPM